MFYILPWQFEGMNTSLHFSRHFLFLIGCWVFAFTCSIIKYVCAKPYLSKIWKQCYLTSSVNISHFFYPALDIKNSKFTQSLAKTPWQFICDTRKKAAECTFTMIQMKDMSLWNLSSQIMISQMHFSWSNAASSFHFPPFQRITAPDDTEYRISSFLGQFKVRWYLFAAALGLLS